MTTALASKQAALNPLKAASVTEVINRVLIEESTKDIAASYGVTRSALNKWLLNSDEEQWKAAQFIRAFKRKEEAEDAMEAAHDALSLARAEKLLRAAQWDLERVCRRIYGQDAPPAGANAVQININLRGKPQDVVVEADKSVIEQPRE